MSGSLKQEGVLGISLGTRTVGMALFLDGGLADWRIKTFWKPWSEDKQAAIIRTILDIANIHGVTKLIMKSPVHGVPGNIYKLCIALEEAARVAGIRCHVISIHDLKRRYSDEYLTHSSVFFNRLLQEYPQLEAICTDKQERSAYHAKLFEAIECAEYALETGL